MTSADGRGDGRAFTRGLRSIRAGTGKGTGGEAMWMSSNGRGFGMGYRCGEVSDDRSGQGTAPGSTAVWQRWKDNNG